FFFGGGRYCCTAMVRVEILTPEYCKITRKLKIMLRFSLVAMVGTGIMTHCLRKIGGDPRKVVYFGDAPWDIKAAESLGWKFVGVGERLSGQCANWMTNYLDPDWTLSSNQSLWQILKTQDH
ncbi:MAG: HAD family hydrolase, partial [Cyanobacteria bacterium P01_A01_bin.17]